MSHRHCITCHGSRSRADRPASATPWARRPPVRPCGKIPYDRLVAETAITAVVDDFVRTRGRRHRINGKFANANIRGSNPMLLVDQICQASGGPALHRPRHDEEHPCGMGVSSSDFDALVGDLVATEQVQGAGEGENELLGALGPMKGDIVESQWPLMR